MAFSLPTLRSALAICQDLHTRAISEGDETMIVKWQAEIDRITTDIQAFRNQGRG